MPRLTLFDEFHVTILVPPALGAAAATAIGQVLDSRSFHRDLGRAVRAVLRGYRTLRPVRVRLSR